MKKLLLFSMCVLFSVSYTQSQTKTKPAEKAPDQQDIQQMMKEAQKALDGMSPEDKKMMEDMGVKMPSLNNMPNVTDQQIQAGLDAESTLVPEKDITRIASISKIPLTTGSLPAFLATINAKVILQLKPESRSMGEEIYQLIKAEHNSATETGNAAIGLWMMGKAELAIYVMGKSCADDPSNVNNLSNYAAMLSMAGAEQLSIPILNNLNKRFPKNSTILNNIGQAWFGLGDIDKSATYLDSTIRIFASHPQANFTKSFIEESKGNMQAAISAATQSIKSGYSTEKENRLYKLGYDLDSKDLSWDKPMPQDPLGLEKFNWPAYPLNVNQSEDLEKEWDAFKTVCRNELENLNEQQKNLEETWGTIRQARTQQLLKAGAKGQNGSLFPPLASKAMKKLDYLVNDKDGHLLFATQQKNEAILAANTAIELLSNSLQSKISGLNENYKDKFGEGKGNPFGAACGDYNEANSVFLDSANTMLRQTQKDYLNFMRRKLNDQIYYDQYTKWPEEFEVEKGLAKIQWISAISSQKIMFKNKSNYCQKEADAEPKRGILQDFDDVHCEYHSELKLPIGQINVDCSRVTSKLDLKMIKLGLKQNMEKGTNDGSVLENFADQFMSCSVEVGASESAGVDTKILKAEASVGVTMRAEFDRTGLTDVILKTEAGVSLGTNLIQDGSQAGVGVSDLSVEAGVEGEISLVSGKSSVESTGILKGVFQK
jgi:hypothetical protein